ncbi:FMN-binding protein [Clostridium saccharoperbutylacetonicum]
MAKKIKKSQVLRHIVQLIMFFALPGLYAMTFNETKTVYKMISEGNFNFIQAFPSLIEFVAVMLVTILIGRWFCGWICAFGAYNDLIYFIAKKVFKGKFKIDEKADSILKYAKYVILLFIIIVSWTFGSSILESTSPWDVFGQITNISTIVNNLLIGLILLVLITIGAAFIERFFCRYLCPLGAVFSIISKVGIVKINKPKADCGKCRACTMNCSMGLNLYKGDYAKGGDCINCLKCTEVCPRKNANINILGQDVNQSLAGSLAMATMLGAYGITNFGVDALTKAGIISNESAILSDASLGAASDNSSQKYKDGTYTGTGHGFGGTTKVSVTIVDGKITDIETISNQDTPDYYSRAFGTISKGIISNQTPQVNAVSGATYSSKGIIEAVKDALGQATVSGSDSTTSSNDNTIATGENAAPSGAESAAQASTNNTKTTATDNTSKTYKDGTYTGSGQGFGGVTKVSVTISNGKITNVKTLSNEDTPEFYQKASSSIMGNIISTQSANVDTVSGATFSSNGIISAVKNALSQAGGAASTAKASQGSISSSSSSNNTANSEPMTPPPVANQNASAQSPVQKSNSSNSTSSQGSTSANSNTNTSKNNNTSQYKDGTYTGTGSGFGGTTKISLTISGGKITGVKTVSNEDTSKYYNRAIGTITNSVISKQSGSVDTVSGATYSSRGIIEAVQNALSQAK